MDLTQFHEEDYKEYLEDIDIAISAMKESLLYPAEDILFDLYAIPSHNHQAYYAVVVEKNGAYEMVYAKTEISYIELDETHGILEVKVPKDWVGKSIIEIDIRKRYGLNIMGIKKNGSINVSFDPSTILSSEITLLVLGELKKLQKFFNI